MHGISPLTTLPGRVTGTKPAAFCHWVFTLLGAAPGDTLDDLFPGSGAISRAWAAYTADVPTHTAVTDALGWMPGATRASESGRHATAPTYTRGRSDRQGGYR